MTVLESIWHYVCFTFAVMGWCLIGTILFAAFAVFFNAIVAIIAAWIMISFGCWMCETELNFARLHYPYLCPPPKW